MSRFKKVTALLLSCAFILSMLGACSQNNSKQTTAATTKATTAAATAAATTQAPQEETKYHFTIAPPLSAPIEPDSDMELYWEDRLNIDLDIVYFENSQYTTLLNLAISSGDVPDAINLSNINNIAQYRKDGVLGGFSREFLKESAPKIYQYIESNLGEKGFNVATFDDGLMYAIAGIYYNNTYPQPLVWNYDWLKAAGIDKAPKTIDEFETALLAFRNNDPDGNGQKDTYGMSNSAMNAIYGAFGAMPTTWLEQSDGNLAYDIAQEGSKEALALLNKWYNAEIIDPEFVTGENKGGYWAISHAFAEERIGLSGHGAFYHWANNEAQALGNSAIGSAELIKTLKPDMNYNFGYAPVGPDGKSGMLKNPAMAYTIGYSKDFVKDEPRFAKFLSCIETWSGFNDPADYLIAGKGIEGTHWDMADGAPVSRPEYSTVEAITAIGGNKTFSMVENHDAEKLLMPARHKWISGIYSDPEMNKFYESQLYVALPSNADYFEESSKVLNEAKISIITGEKPIEYYDEAINLFMKVGGDILTKEANDWYATQK